VKDLEQMLSKLGGSGSKDGSQDGSVGAMAKLLKSNGGIQGMAARLTQNGMGQKVQSWIGHGDNQSISGDQVQQALDPNSVRQFAEQTGTTTEQASSHLAQMLPKMMDHASPDGKMPSEDPFSKGMSALKNFISR
jgi:uncharacterized protein YidB (DUF937 family)